MAEFTNEEYADIHYFYGLANGNALAAREAYGIRYPGRRLPTDMVFSDIHRRLRETGRVRFNRNEGHATNRRFEGRDERILQAVRENPSISIRRLSLQLNLSTTLIFKVLHQERLHPFHTTTVQEILLADKEHRLEFCNWLLERQINCNTFLPNILWTDESQFTRDGITNYHNLHTWANENPHTTRTTSFQHRFSLNVWAGVIGDMLIGPFFLPPRLNSAAYLHFLQRDLPGLLEDVPLSQRARLLYQQDGAPSHYGRIVTEWFNENYPNRWIGRNGPIHWPARSPDLTVMDFYVWGTMKEKVYSTEITTCEELKQRIEAAAQKIRDQLPTIRITRAIQQRALACIQMGGGHFEQLL